VEKNLEKEYETSLDSQIEVKIVPTRVMNDIAYKLLQEDGWELVEITDDGYGEGSFVFNRRRK